MSFRCCKCGCLIGDRNEAVVDILWTCDDCAKQETAAMRRYKECLQRVREAQNRGDADRSDALLEEMNALWWGMSDAERDVLDNKKGA